LLTSVAGGADADRGAAAAPCLTDASLLNFGPFRYCS